MGAYLYEHVGLWDVDGVIAYLGQKHCAHLQQMQCFSILIEVSNVLIIQTY